VHFPNNKSLLVAVTGEGGGIAAAANYAARRFIRENLADAWRMLNGNNLYLMDNASAR
jgi:nucleotidyltransferase/DNA polymerase involved in DNA repair